ncbi:hypothetical protein AWENTII_005113 [Aspergillus wentii]
MLLVWLSQTNRYLGYVVDVPKHPTAQQRLSHLCAAETSTGYENYFICSRCLQIQHHSKFADNQVTGKRGKCHCENNRGVSLSLEDKRVWTVLHHLLQV